MTTKDNDNNEAFLRTYVEYACSALLSLERLEEFIFDNKESSTIDQAVLRLALLSMGSLLKNIVRHSLLEKDEDDDDQDGYPEPPY